jgi:hypothetical protein
MATKKAPTEQYEGHGESSVAPSVKKGTFEQVGTFIPMASKAISPNVKTSTSSGGEQ